MNIRRLILGLFIVMAILSAFYTTRLKFAFDFEQFFPDGDADLAFFREFIKDFETDDNFMLIAIKRQDGVFEQSFLTQFHDFSVKARSLPHVLESQSLTKLGYPIKTPFLITTIPIIHINQPEFYEADRNRVLKDERFVHNLISEDGRTLVVYLKMVSSIQLDDAREFMSALNKLIANYHFEDFHYLGRPYFQQELVRMQIREVLVSALVAALLVSLILFFVFRRAWGIFIALSSIGLGMLLFMGWLGLTGRELSAMAALYPVLMIIVGTSDVIHIMIKYVEELSKGRLPAEAIRITIKEIGLATLLTSATTAVGFATLLTSRIPPIREFGLNAAMGVGIAYFTVIVYTTTMLTFFKQEQIIRLGMGQQFWDRLLLNIYRFTITRRRTIIWSTLALIPICGLGISLITTNYNIIGNMPRGEKITADFHFFEHELTGFRPLEFAVFAKNNARADDFAVLKEVDKIENYLRQFPSLQAIASATVIYKSIHQMMNNNRPDAYQMPSDKSTFLRYKQLADKLPQLSPNILISKDGKKARITSRVQDLGADTLKLMGARIDKWIDANVDDSLVRVQRTGTGLIIDKNAEYVRDNLLQGIAIAVFIIAVLMGFLFGSLKMTLLSLIPNVIPLLFAGAILGYAGIELEAGISIVFTVVFGIAVDDTIHFLSRFKLAKSSGLNTEAAIQLTFRETGKAIVLTTVLLFFGFLVMLFSIHPPSVAIGLVISVTLISALAADIFLLPILLRWAYPNKKESEQCLPTK